MVFSSFFRLWTISLFLPLCGFAQSAKTSESPQGKGYWEVFAGGEWDFLRNDGAPLNGKDWQEAHYGIGYVDKADRWSVTASHRIVGRTDRFDNVLNLEAYAPLVGPLGIRAMFAWSPDADFVYRYRADGDLEYYVRPFCVGAGYWFMDFNSTNIHIATPFARWYHRDLVVDFRYLAIYDTFEHEWFHAGAVRIDNTFNDRWLRPFIGFAGGRRIFGIMSLQQSAGQKGILAYAGNRFGINAKTDLSVMLSYGQEESFFHYVGAGVDVVFRF